MAAFDYSKIAATAVSLMEKFGTHNCRVLRPATSSVDVDKPWKGEESLPDTVVLASVTILMGGTSRLHPGGPHLKNERGTLTPMLKEAGVAFMCTGGNRVLPGDYIEVPLASGATDRIAVADITPIKPGGAELLWQLNLEA